MRRVSLKTCVRRVCCRSEGEDEEADEGLPPKPSWARSSPILGRLEANLVPSRVDIVDGYCGGPKVEVGRELESGKDFVGARKTELDGALAEPPGRDTRVLLENARGLPATQNLHVQDAAQQTWTNRTTRFA